MTANIPLIIIADNIKPHRQCLMQSFVKGPKLLKNILKGYLGFIELMNLHIRFLNFYPRFTVSKKHERGKKEKPSKSRQLWEKWHFD